MISPEDRTMSDQELLERIILSPSVMTGKPMIKGTRLTVEYILNLLAHGSTVYRERRPHKGVVLMRLDDERATNKVEVLRRLLEAYADRLAGHFVVVTEKRVRFARM
jgi:hypothetical protein